MKLLSGVSERNLSQKQSWDQHAGIALVEASIAHNHYWTFKTFMDMIHRYRMHLIEGLLMKTSRLC